MDVPPVVSARLELVSLSPAFLVAALAGDLREAERLLELPLPSGWAEESAGVMRRRLKQLQERPEVQPWLLRAIVLRGPRRVLIGRFNFHGPPEDGTAELGYTIQPEHRRRGYATEATAAMLDWAQNEHGVRRFIASISPDNEPSLRLARRLGFEQIGEQIDEEDGLELVFELIRD